MKFGKALIFLAYLFVSFHVSTTAKASDSIDIMLENLSQTMNARDWSGTAELIAEYQFKNPRNLNGTEDELVELVKGVIDKFKVMGKLLSNGVVKKDVCGDKIAHAMLIAYTTKGQVAISLWFFNIADQWFLSHWNAFGEYDPETFTDVIAPLLIKRC